MINPIIESLYRESVYVCGIRVPTQFVIPLFFVNPDLELLMDRTHNK